jgi:hypothetical protein
LHDPVWSHVHDFFGGVIISAFDGVFDAPILFTVEVGEDSILVC